MLETWYYIFVYANCLQDLQCILFWSLPHLEMHIFLGKAMLYNEGATFLLFVLRMYNSFDSCCTWL